MSATVYNNVNLSAYLLTQSVEQRTGYDPSNTDQLYTVSRIRIQTILNAAFLPATVGEDPGDTAARIKHYLTAPRKPFTFTAGNGLLINLPGGLDDANGPKPIEFDIKEITPASFVVTWGVEVCLTECGSQPPPWLSLRWSETQSHDRNWVTTRHRSGLLILSSRAGASGDDYRGLAAPTLPIGFRRESANYGHTEDGLHWKFDFVDKELPGKQPPFPATEIRGYQVESIPLLGGMRKGEISISLTAPPGVAPRDLLAVGVRLCMKRIWASNPQQFGNTNGRVMMGGTIKEDLSDERNGIDLRFEWNMRPAGVARVNADGGAGIVFGLGAAAGGAAGNPNQPPPTPEGNNPAGVPMFADWLGAPLAGSMPGWPAAPPTRGTTIGLSLVAAILRDPCGLLTSLATSSGANENVLSSSTAVSATVSQITAQQTLPQVDDLQALYAIEDQPGVWDNYKVRLIYNLDPGVIVVGTTVSGTKSVKIRTQSETAKLRLEWALVRIGGKPTPLPFENFADDNWILVSPGNIVELENLDLAADGVSIRFCGAGVSYFAALDPSKVNVLYPIPPFLQAAILRTVQLATQEFVLVGGPVVGP